MAIKLSRELKEQFASLLEQHPPRQFSSALRSMLLDYVHNQIKLGLPLEFGGLLCSLNDLFDLLDMAAEEMESEEKKAEG